MLLAVRVHRQLRGVVMCCVVVMLCCVVVMLAVRTDSKGMLCCCDVDSVGEDSELMLCCVVVMLCCDVGGEDRL